VVSPSISAVKERLAEGDSEATVENIVGEAQSRALDSHRQGDVLRKEGRFESAIAFYQGAIRLNPEFSWSHHSLGDCYKKLGDWESAIAAYRRAIAINGDFEWSHYSLGESLEQIEDWASAADCYRRVREISPENKPVLPRLAIVLKSLVVEDPRNVAYYKDMGEVLLAEGKTVEATAAYQMALQICPEDSAAAQALSQLASTEDRPAQAYLALDRSESTVVTYQDIRSVETLCDNRVVTALLRYTHLFDVDYYRAQHQELSALYYQELLQHYVTEGSAAGYQPNPLFDDAFYRRQHPELVAKGVNPLAHYHCFGYKVGEDPHPFFSTRLYLEKHADVAAAKVDPLEHYLSFGAKEGRTAFSAEQFPHLLQGITPQDAPYLELLQDSNNTVAPQLIGVYCNSVGNYFITEIADLIAAALTSSGHMVVRLTDEDAVPEDLDAHWVVAPHEFFYLGAGESWAQKREWRSQAVMVNVEQPQTSWFSKSFHFLRHAKVVFDINVKSAAIMHALGLPAYWLPLGYLEKYVPFTATESLPALRAVASLPEQVRCHLPPMEAPLSERPLDIQFIGTLNKRRESFFARSAHWLSNYRCFLHMPPMGVPLLKGQDQALDTEAVIGISRRSKILLNVHRDDLPYFEWHRMVFHGLWQNTLVVTEPCHDIPGLVAGEHFVACEMDEIAQKIEWLLRSPEGKVEAERIRRAGYSILRSRFNSVDVIANAVQQVHMALNKIMRVAA